MSLQTQTLGIKKIPTSPIAGQATGTSGLRKKVAVFQQDNYLANWVQSLFSALAETGRTVSGSTLALGGDGRFFNKEAIQIIIKIAAANGVGTLLVGQHGLLSTPATSAVIRTRKALGGIILTASHNPGGPNADFGIKYNTENGGPAPEALTEVIYRHTTNIKEVHSAEAVPDIDLSEIRSHQFGPSFVVQVIDPVADYLAILRQVFDFDVLQKFVSRSDFRFLFDGLHGVGGPYAKRIFIDELGASSDALMNCDPKEDFGGGHPDPNLTYARDLVGKMYAGENAPDFGAASDGDADRNMVLGKNCFVTPSDSVAIIAAHAMQAIPYFKSGIKGVARSMPTSTALDRVAHKLGVDLFVVPTGWKYFGNLMDAGRLSICGEESFGTGSSHIREKDGLWAVLAWLSILAHKNKNTTQLVSIQDIVEEHWREYGRSFYCRYDYEEVELKAANKMMKRLSEMVSDQRLWGTKHDNYTIAQCDEFSYKDPIDSSVTTKQGIRFVFTDGSIIVFRLSGTGSSGATIRLYMEQYEKNEIAGDSQDKVKPLSAVALGLSQLKEFTGRDHPTVIT